MHATFRPFHHPTDRHVNSQLLDKTNIDVLDTLGVHPIRNQFSPYPLCMVYLLWKPDELHQLLPGLCTHLLDWLQNYLKPRNVKVQLDNRFRSVPRYPGLKRFSKPFDSVKCGSWHANVIQGMITTLAVNCAPILNYSKDDRKTSARTSSDEKGMGAVWAFCEFSLLVSQQNHSDLSLTALDDALKRFYNDMGTFHEHKMLKSAMVKVD